MLDQQDLQKIGELMDTKIENFAVIVNDGFSGMRNEMNERFTSVDNKLKAVDERFTVADFNFSEFRQEMNEKLERADQRMDKLYNAIDGFMALHQKLDQELTMLSARVTRLEEQLKKFTTGALMG